MKDQKGQIILLLILVMTVALAIGLSVIQRSLTDVSTSSKVDQSARAYFAAEAGIEKTLAAVPFSTPFPLPFPLANNSQIAALEDSNLIPPVPSVGTRQAPLEYPPLPKEDVVQVWLADPGTNVNLPGCTKIDPSGPDPVCYKQTSLDVYWGDSVTDKAALELTLVYYDGQYKSRKWFLDNVVAREGFENNFDVSTSCTGFSIGPDNNSYQCYKRLGNSIDCTNRLGQPCSNDSNYDTLPSSGLMLIRARLLYNENSQPFAVQAVGTCPPAESCEDYALPPQARTITSTGVSGTTQRRVKLFQKYNVVPPEFDYAIFSSGAITK